MANPRLVSDVMVRSPRFVGPEVSVASAFELMLDGTFRHLPVVQDGRAVGMLSDRDIMKHMPPPSVTADRMADHGRFAQLKVSQIMAQPALSVLESDGLDVAVELMLMNQISALVVSDAQERLIGILTLVDVARAFLRLLRLAG